MAAVGVLEVLGTIEMIVEAGNKLIKENSKEIIEKKIIPFHCALAPSYGRLKDGSSIKQMDDNLKIIIAGTTNMLSKMINEATKENKSIDEALSWENVLGAVSQNPLLEPMPEAEDIFRSDKLIKDETNWFKFDGSPDEPVVKEVHAWFVKLISDDDVLNDTKIDIRTLGCIVAQTGATITDLETVFYKKEYHEQKVVDIGILRYPDISHPHFKLYRIRLTAWSNSERILGVQRDRNGITGEFQSRKFKPRDDVINKMSEAIKEKAVKEAEDLFP